MPLSTHAKRAYNRVKQAEFRERRKSELDSDRSETRCLGCHNRHLRRNAQYARIRAILEKDE